jgi:imidazole glycerol-phosphate synthase subunit HisF
MSASVHGDVGRRPEDRLAARVIPCLDVESGRVVKGVNFVGLRDAGDPVELARRYDLAGADELVLLDITASSDSRDIIIDVVERCAAQLSIPFTIGGGVRSVEDARRLLAAGADKVSVNTAAVADPELLDRIAAAVGSQSVVIAVDARRRAPDPDPVTERGAVEAPSWEVVTHGGRTGTGLDVVAWCVEAVRRGAGEILLTSMDRDGTRDGYDLDLLAAVSDAVEVPVIASGGAGEAAHMAEAVVQGGAAAVLAASILHFGDVSVDDVKDVMQACGIPVRRDVGAD